MNAPKNRAPINPTPSIGVSGLLFRDDGQVLLIQRNQAPAKGLWSLPGGRLEPGETLAGACGREFHEETGLEVEARNIVAIVERQLEGFHYIIIDFMVALKDEAKCHPIPQSDVTDAKWIHLADLGRFEVVKGLQEIILRAHHFKQIGTKVGLHANYPDASDYILTAFNLI
jgi:8-oxo-dGTP diphosphatase